jgi:hypothetical protein
MKSIVISVLMFSMTLLFVSCENEGQPTQNTSDMEKQLLSKKPKPGKKPDRYDWISFTGDLIGGEEVYGCCPNRGPSPPYTLELVASPFPPDISEIQHNGEIFMNNTGLQSPGDYMVQFFIEFSTGKTMYLEIRGGKATLERRTKILTVIFTYKDTLCEIWRDGKLTDTIPVEFTLIRAPHRR